MKKNEKIKNHRGENIIYVGECDKYIHENPDVEKKTLRDLHNSENTKISDILYAIENYYRD